MIAATLASVVLASVLGLYLTFVHHAPPTRYNAGGLVPQSLYSSLYTAAHAPYGEPNSSYSAYFSGVNGASYTIGNKPIIVYVGGEFCGLCGAERWPLVMALMRFGNFSNLRLMTSSPSDQFPNVSSFSFFGTSFSSEYIAFRPYEAWDRNGQPQQIVPQNYTQVWKAANQTIPFLNFGNQYVLRGIFSPAILESRNWTQTVSLITSGKGVGLVVSQVANAMSAVICATNGGFPTSVCADPAISGFLLIGKSSPGLNGRAGGATNDIVTATIIRVDVATRPTNDISRGGRESNLLLQAHRAVL